MVALPTSLQRLVEELSKLPSIGEKSALRLAYYLISRGASHSEALAQAIVEAKEKIHFCAQCFFISEQELCDICRQPSRDNTLLCVVEKPMDVVAIERLGEFRGLYHVLHGVWAPLKGRGPESIRLKELQERIGSGAFREIILATSSTVEGDATAAYISKLLPANIQVSRLAQGMPKGGELEYADDITLSRAFSGRNRLAD